MRILCVEDNEDSLELLRFSLKGNGYDVSSATNGLEALAIARENLPDIIVSDIMMPEMDGFALCRNIKGDTSLKDIPFIFYTATYLDPKERELGLALGAARYLEKPMEPSELLKAINDVTEEAKSGQLTGRDAPEISEHEVSDAYGQVLARKLEKKIVELEEQQEISKQSLQMLRHNEERFRDFAETSADWLWETDEEHKFSFVSESIIHSTSGLRAKNIVGKKRTDFVKEDVARDPEKWKKHLADLDAHRSIKNFRYSVVTPKGDVREFSIRGKPVFDADGTFKGYRGVGSDITQDIQAERALRESVQEFRLAIEKSPLPIALTKANGDIEHFNPKFQETFGWTVDDIKTAADWWMAAYPDPEHRKRVTNSWEHAINEAAANNEEIVVQQWNLTCKSGNVREVEFRMVPLTKDRHLIVMNDITERMRTEEELKDHRDHLEELVAKRTNEVQEKAAQLESALEREKEYSILQQKFVTLVSHEFRTPLTIIDGTAQRLIRRKDKLDGDEVETRANKVRAAVTRMISMIDTTLYVSQLDAGKIEMQSAPSDIGELLRDVCERQAEISPDHQFNVAVEGLPNEMQVDRRLLDQVFTNLLSNAVKYAPRAPLIEVKGWQDNRDGVITVTDRGVGIPEDELPHMFGRFFRASTAEGIKGTGLGLSVCKEFVEMHGGTIGVASVEGEGTTFTVHLPIIMQGHKNFGSGI